MDRKKIIEYLEKNLANDIFNEYYNRKFGKIVKNEVEVLLFKNYVDACINNNLSVDDYTLSKDLGITQSKVRSLKQLKYKKYDLLDDDWWKIKLNSALENVHFDCKENKIKVVISDVNVKEEVINFIESNGWYDDRSLNNKLLTIPIDCYLEIFVDSEAFDKTFSKQSIEKLKKISKNNSLEENELNTLSKFISAPSKEALFEIAKTGSKEIIKLLLSTLPFGGLLGKAIDTIINVIDKSM